MLRRGWLDRLRPPRSSATLRRPSRALPRRRAPPLPPKGERASGFRSRHRLVASRSCVRHSSVIQLDPQTQSLRPPLLRHRRFAQQLPIITVDEALSVLEPIWNAKTVTAQKAHATDRRRFGLCHSREVSVGL